MIAILRFHFPVTFWQRLFYRKCKYFKLSVLIADFNFTNMGSRVFSVKKEENIKYEDYVLALGPYNHFILREDLKAFIGKKTNLCEEVFRTLKSVGITLIENYQFWEITPDILSSSPLLKKMT